MSCNRFQVAKSYWLCQHSWKPLLAWSLVKVHSMNMLAPFWDYNLVGCDTMWWARALISAGIFTCVFTKFSFHFPTIFKWMLVLSWIFCGSFITTWFNLYLFNRISTHNVCVTWPGWTKLGLPSSFPLSAFVHHLLAIWNIS